MNKSSIFKKRIRLDLIISIIIYVIILIILIIIDALEHNNIIVTRHGYLELDEILISLALGNLIFSWFAYRRWRDFKTEFETSEYLNKRLSEALTARKKAQSALSASWRRFVDIAEMSPDWIWECDENFHFTYVSDQFLTATGMSRKQILHQGWADLGAKSGSRELYEKLESRLPFHSVEISMPRKKGKLARWLVSGRPVFSDEGVFTGYRGIGTDMAEVKLSGAGNCEYSDHLEELINLAVMGHENLDTANNDVKLTPREKEILGWVKQGKSYAEIAEILSISRRTIEFHIGNVMNKLGASNRVSAVVIAMRRGILGS
jgi:PAS domain S-box-containing protein